MTSSNAKTKSEKLLASFNRKPPEPSVSQQNSPLTKARNRFDIADEVAAGALSDSAGDSVDHKHASAQLVTIGHRGQANQQPLPDDLSEPYRKWCVENDYAPGQTITIPLSKLKETSYNPRHFYPPKLLESLIANLAENQQQQPIHVIPDYDNPGSYFINDGGRRVRSLRMLKRHSALAIAVDIPIGIQSYKFGFDLNNQRESQTPFDNAVKWRRMLDEGLFATQRELAEVIGVDEGSVAQTLSLAKLPEDIMMEMVISADSFGRRMAYEIGRFYEKRGRDAEQTLALIRRIVREEMSLRQVQQVIAADTSVSTSANTKGSRSQRAVFNQRIEYKLASGDIAGELKTYGDDRLDLQLRGLSQEMRDTLQRTIEDVLKPLHTPHDAQPEQTETRM